MWTRPKSGYTTEKAKEATDVKLGHILVSVEPYLPKGFTVTRFTPYSELHIGGIPIYRYGFNGGEWLVNIDDDYKSKIKSVYDAATEEATKVEKNSVHAVIDKYCT